jgi:hypothetical protein
MIRKTYERRFVPFSVAFWLDEHRPYRRILDLPVLEIDANRGTFVI